MSDIDETVRQSVMKGTVAADYAEALAKVDELEAELKQCRNRLVVCKMRNKNLMLMLHKSAIGEQSDE